MHVRKLLLKLIFFFFNLNQPSMFITMLARKTQGPRNCKAFFTWVLHAQHWQMDLLKHTHAHAHTLTHFKFFYAFTFSMFVTLLIKSKYSSPKCTLYKEYFSTLSPTKHNLERTLDKKWNWLNLVIDVRFHRS